MKCLNRYMAFAFCWIFFLYNANAVLATESVEDKNEISGNTDPTLKEKQYYQTIIDISEDGIALIKEFAGRKKSLSEEELLAIMQATAGHQMESYVYVDMDHDGLKELVGVYPDDMYFYQTWYCSSDGKKCLLVHQNKEEMDACAIELLDLNDETHVVINAYRMIGTGKNYSIISLKGEDISCLASNKYGYVSMTEDGDIVLDVEAYDSMYDPAIQGMIGHTWKDTYLYFDGETYKEYGATEMTETEYLSFKNAQSIKNAIADELTQPDTTKLEYTYFIRKNHILHIQCNVYNSFGTIQYGYYTIRFDGDVLNEQLGEYRAGQMASSFSDWNVDEGA